MSGNGLPEKQGLYNPSMEKDSCGVGFIAHIKGKKSHEILQQGLQILKNLQHRGAVDADATTGDGSGVLMQIPHDFLKIEAKKLDIELPEYEDYGVGMIFLPREPHSRIFCEGVVERILKEEGQKLLGWRTVPIEEEACGEAARATRPVVVQIFIDRNKQTKEVFERKLLMVRKRAQKAIRDTQKPYTESFYICSLSSRTIIYKGLIAGCRLQEFYADLTNSMMKTAIVMIHERYSTNTFPSWKLAQPFRYIAHNGEINTIRGNINWMQAREGVMRSKRFGKEFSKILPIMEPGGSDSASFDNAVELFAANAHSLEYIMMMLIPEAWQNDYKMDREKRGFYEYHARVMEPWDGPATIAFTDGIKVGVTVDRNGLRPARYITTKDDLVIMASEIGVLDIAPEKILEKGCLQPGKILLVNTEEGRIISDEEIKAAAYQRKPFGNWVEKNRMTLKDIEKPFDGKKMSFETLHRNQLVFGFTKEELEKVLCYMTENGKEPIGSMGIDTPLAILSERPQLLFNYFKQKFAQVTNPPIDPIREALIMSLIQFIGTHGKLLDEIETEKDNKYILLEHPVILSHELEGICSLYTEDFRSATIPCIFQADHEGNGLRHALDYLCKRAEESVRLGYNILVLSDRNVDMYNAPIPSLLALGAVHHHLVRKKLRTAVDLIVEAGDARDVMHMALLVGFGAKAIHPYMAFESIGHMVEKKENKKLTSLEEAFIHYRDGISEGLLKIISRMGISTLQSYCGAQIFEAIGIHQEVIEEYFTDTPAVLSGIGLDEIAKEVLARHQRAYREFGKLDAGGELSYRKDGEYHILHPDAIRALRKASIEGDLQKYRVYAHEVNAQNEKRATIRSLLNFKKINSIPLESVEPVENILKRFRISGMSFGSLSMECHETLAVAMNRLGGASNSGEGGEDPRRYALNGKGQDLKSAVKQVASGRFGVNINYLVNCNELEIKVAQGAKPGEGGHLPGDKVTPEIARVRHSTPEIDLISPPPHHDIYSIEDLSQLIFDLKNANPEGRVGVKLVSQMGVGTVAAGVVKSHADFVLIGGHDGGSGAAPISSMKYVGLPWELGLAEAQQTLLLNNLRGKVTLQVDGKMLTGRDVVIAALLGAEEYGFATAPLIASGCVVCRQCHLNKCPAGIATQDLKLRENFKGEPEHVMNYLTFVAEEVREYMAQLGFKTMDEMIGRVDALEIEKVNLGKLKDCHLYSLLYKPELPSRIAGKCGAPQKFNKDGLLDNKILKDTLLALEEGKNIVHHLMIRNTDRSFGTMLSGEIARYYGEQGVAEDAVMIGVKGSAGQSFGAFTVKGLTLMLEGDANDYLGKGLSGGKIIVIPPEGITFEPSKNIIAGNTLLYGATAGEAYISGRVGQRFCVRNSGAVAVVEGVGDHGCEYMTGGVVVILGTTGRNFGAGMSGGVAYVLDEENGFRDRCNLDMVSIERLESPKDVQLVKDLIHKHYLYTQSDKAKKILGHWNDYQKKFVKAVSPVYQKQMEQIG
ncbi:glutamate synthase (NADPH/NADH) large chain [Anaerosolibacter carboniphilus]|uniref:Glutamate synthase (NADPH/NADH) large chain n=1 Tax=Anaerosolibacter carboniphilus TaxID=1417629 RepID=A0A841KJT8_9FIRM|nr:glutamate synthase large subunit [Anaerosolibacter carboniphilus]MBB6214134.1 glutamate synthase (NADPH/NADH) large chain [Anaerosolibacter carboniphilus]